MNNSKEIMRDGKTYIFVTRGRSKPYSDDEVAEYFNENTSDGMWKIPDNKQREIMFLRDLQQRGLDFCADKYVVSRDDIIREARRLAPHITLGV